MPPRSSQLLSLLKPANFSAPWFEASVLNLDAPSRTSFKRKRMNLPHSPRSGSALLLSLIAAAGLSATSLFAQSVTTAPVGAMSITVNAGSDQKVGLPLIRPSLYAGKVASVSSGVVTTSSAVSGLGSDSKFIKFTSGNLAGQWFTVTASSASTISVAENLATLGAAANDTFEVRPFWTLASLLPNGGGLPVSADVFDPTSFVLLNDPTAAGINLSASAAYFYHDGSSGFLSAGWYNADGSFADANAVIVSPEVSLTYRNGSGTVAKVLNIGSVPSSKIANAVVSRVAGDQDNLVYNPYPANVTLANAGLNTSQAVRASADVFSPGDQVLVFDSASTGLNPSSSQSYFYHDGSSGFLGAGWYKGDGSFESADTVALAPGAAIVIRKVGGSSTEVNWNPSLPYTL